MSLSKKQLAHVCLRGAGSRECRYLSKAGYYGTGACDCLKTLVKQKSQRDKEVAKFMADCKKNSMNPHQAWSYNMVGLGNGANCPGYPALSQIEQGYDKKGTP